MDPDRYLLLLSIDRTPEDEEVRDLFPFDASSLGTLMLLRKALARGAPFVDESATFLGAVEVETSGSR